MSLLFKLLRQHVEYPSLRERFGVPSRRGRFGLLLEPGEITIETA